MRSSVRFFFICQVTRKQMPKETSAMARPMPMAAAMSPSSTPLDGASVAVGTRASKAVQPPTSFAVEVSCVRVCTAVSGAARVETPGEQEASSLAVKSVGRRRASCQMRVTLARDSVAQSPAQLAKALARTEALTARDVVATVVSTCSCRSPGGAARVFATPTSFSQTTTSISWLRKATSTAVIDGSRTRLPLSTPATTVESRFTGASGGMPYAYVYWVPFTHRAIVMMALPPPAAACTAFRSSMPTRGPADVSSEAAAYPARTLGQQPSRRSRTVTTPTTAGDGVGVGASDVPGSCVGMAEGENVGVVEGVLLMMMLRVLVGVAVVVGVRRSGEAVGVEAAVLLPVAVCDSVAVIVADGDEPVVEDGVAGPVMEAVGVDTAVADELEPGDELPVIVPDCVTVWVGVSGGVTVAE